VSLTFHSRGATINAKHTGVHHDELQSGVIKAEVRFEKVIPKHRLPAAGERLQLLEELFTIRVCVVSKVL
jgi:hypothetical protein